MDDGTGEGRENIRMHFEEKEKQEGEACYVTTDVSSEPFGGTYISEVLPGSELREKNGVNFHFEVRKCLEF